MSTPLRKNIKKVMLVNPPGKIAITFQGSRERKLAVPPLGLAYLAASLRDAGIEVAILDVLVEGYQTEKLSENIVTYGLTDAEVRERIRDFNPDMIGVSCLFSNRGQEALNLCKLAKEELPDAYVVLGGQHPSGLPSMVMDPNVDYILFGEADLAIVEFINAVNNGSDLREVSQIIMKDGDRFWRSSQTCLPGVKDRPLPAWDYVKLDKYWAAGLHEYEVSEDPRGNRFMVMIASRGCPHACDFCTAPMMTGRKYRQREIADVLAEIQTYIDKYGVTEINFWDDNFFINTKRVKELLRAVSDAFPGLTFQVPSGGEINAIDDETIDLMKKAGFKKLFMAVESANEEIQATQVDKKVKLHRINALVDRLRDVGIISEGSFMVGFPGETKAQIDNTFKRAQEFGFDRISISIVNPLPGTDLYKEVIEKGLLPEDFDPQNIRWSMENIKLDGVERGYIAEKRRAVWLEYMKDRIEIEKYEKQNVSSDWTPGVT